jgi:multidrug resistance efflux pump
MLTPEELEHWRKEDRWKARLDTVSFQAEVEELQKRLSSAQEELKRHQQKRDARYAMIGVIGFCQRRLGKPITPREELCQQSLAELSQMAKQLEEEPFRA